MKISLGVQSNKHCGFLPYPPIVLGQLPGLSDIFPGTIVVSGHGTANACVLTQHTGIQVV